MFTLQCDYYSKTFTYIYELLEDIIQSGQDPDYEILMNGESTGVRASQLIIPQA